MKTKKVSRVVVIGAAACLLFALIFIYISYLFQLEFENTTVAAAQQQLSVIAKSTATILEEFITERSKALKIFSSNPSFQEELYNKYRHRKPDTTYCPIKVLYEINKEYADALTVLDANGIMLHRHPFIEDRLGMDHTDKPGVAYVLREYQPYISNFFYNNLGNPSISVSEPVFYKGEFVGIVRWMIQLNTISKHFIQPIKVGKKGYGQVLDSEGTILSHPEVEHVGRHIMALRKERFPERDWTELEAVVEKMTNGEQGVGVYHSALWPEKETRMVKKLLAYAPVHVGNILWSVSVVMDYSEIAGPIRKNAIKTFVRTGFIMLLFGTTGIVFFRIRRKKVELEKETKYLKEIAKSAEALKKARDRLEIRVEERTSELAAANEELRVEITERKQTEKALLQERNKAQSYLDVAGVMLVAMGDDENISLINRKGCEILGYEEKEIVGKNWFDTFVPERMRKEVRTIFAKLIAGEIEPVKYYENSVLTKSGEERIIAWHNTVLRDETDNIICSLSSGEDITERKQTEEELRQSENRFRQFFENEPAYCYMVSPEGFILDVNKAAIETLEYGKAELVGKPLKTIYAPESHAQMKENLEEWKKTGTLENAEMVVQAKSGEKRIVLLSVSAVKKEDGEILHSISVQKDITESKRAEEKIKASLKEKEVLLREIHHRVKNNLQIISGLLDLSIMRTQNQEIIDVLQDSRLRIHTIALIHEQLYKSERFDKIDMIKNIRALLDIQIPFYVTKDKSIKLVVEGADVYLTINQAIPCALVLNELISNAFKHAFKKRERGTIAVSARRAPDDSVLIMVKDDGVGIPESVDINRVNTLGLKLVKNLAQNQLKGSIKVNRDNGIEIIIQFKT